MRTTKVLVEDERGGSINVEQTVVYTRGDSGEGYEREEKVDESAADASVWLRVELDNTRGLERLVPTP